MEQRPNTSAWGIGCYVCNLANAKSKFARVEVSGLKSMNLQGLLEHCRSKEHDHSLKALVPKNVPDSPWLEPEAAVSGLGNVPRIDRFVAALTAIKQHDSYESHKSTVQQMGVGSALEAGSSGAQESKQIQAALAGPLHAQTLKAMSGAMASSLAVDKSDGVLLVIARMLLPTGIYDAVVGLETDVGADSKDISDGLQRIIRNACMKQTGRRDQKD